jgi:hypothetical protein
LTTRLLDSGVISFLPDAVRHAARPQLRCTTPSHPYFAIQHQVIAHWPHLIDPQPPLPPATFHTLTLVIPAINHFHLSLRTTVSPATFVNTMKVSPCLEGTQSLYLQSIESISAIPVFLGIRHSVKPRPLVQLLAPSYEPRQPPS